MIELFKAIILDKSINKPLYIQLYEKLKEPIISNTLLPHLRLPSIRQLSESLAVNQVTVVSALKRLEAEGYIYSKPGSGNYVSDIHSRVEARSTGINAIQDEVYRQDDFPVTSRQIAVSENTINFASATPTPDLFPIDNFKAVLNEVLDRDRGNAFGYQESQGFYPARQSILKTLERQGIKSEAEQVMIISGAQQGIDIIAKALLRQEDCVLTESPTYTGAIAAFNSRRVQILDVEMKEGGPSLAAIEYMLKSHRPKLIYTMPSFQNPTGYSYNNEKRRELLKLADKYDCYIIEDYYVADLDFEGRNYIPLKSMDENQRVIFIKSYSKIFMPGLRLGFMIIPPALQQNLLEAKHTTDISTSGLIQRAFDLYVRRGFWDEHFNYMYKIYKERYEKLIEALRKYAPGEVKYTAPGGGLNIWLELPEGLAIGNLVKRASSGDVVFAPGYIFYGGTHLQNQRNIRLSFASVPKEQIDKGVALLFDAMKSLQTSKDTQLPIL